MTDPRGQHVLIDLFECDRATLDDPAALRAALETAATAAGASVIKVEHHQFSPQGVTAFALLNESHISVHTWPETGYAGADIYTCGNTDPRAAVEPLVAALGAATHSVRVVERGAVTAACRRGADAARA